MMPLDVCVGCTVAPKFDEEEFLRAMEKVAAIRKEIK